jgi:hypothetical protein
VKFVAFIEIWDFPYALPMYSLFHYQPQQSGTFVTIDKSKLIHHYHPKYQFSGFFKTFSVLPRCIFKWVATVIYFGFLLLWSYTILQFHSLHTFNQDDPLSVYQDCSLENLLSKHNGKIPRPFLFPNLMHYIFIILYDIFIILYDTLLSRSFKHCAILVT